MSGKSSGKSPEKSAFAEAFTRHLDRGTRPAGAPRVWRDEEFAGAVPNRGEPATAIRNVRGWRSGTTPLERDIKPILTALFGTDPANPDRQELWNLWEDANRRKPRRKLHTEPAEPVEVPAGPPPPPPTSQEPGWEPDPPWYLRSDFARLDVEPQPPSGPPDQFALTVSLRLDSNYMKIESGADSPRLAVTVRADRVQILTDEEKGKVQPVPITILGNPGNEFPNVTHGVGWHIENPKGQNDNPFSGVKLCDMRLRGEGPHGVELTLRCRDIDLDIKIHNPPPDLTAKDAAILRRVLQRMDCNDPDAEHVELARGGLHRGKLP